MKTRIKTKTVQELLTRRCISQNNLAQRVQVTKGYLSQLLAGTRYPSPQLRLRLMHELKADFDSLFELLDREATQ